MTGRRLRTADYPEDARRRLGSAVSEAREALGFKFRPPFAKHAKVSLRSLVDLEAGTPGVGEANLKAVARALPNWTESTPRDILEGGPIPPPEPAPPAETKAEWVPVLTDAQVIAMTSREIATHYVQLDNSYGKQAADDWLFHAASIRYHARRAAQDPFADGAANA